MLSDPKNRSHGVVIGALGNLGPTWVDCYLQLFAEVTAVVEADQVELARQTFGENGRLHVATVDVSNEDSVRRLADRFSRTSRRVDALVLNAGVDVPPSVEARADVRPIVDVNLLGAMYVFAVFQDLVIDGGAIVLIGSMYADLAPRPSNYAHLPDFVKNPAYGATKAACLSLVRQYAGLLGHRGVRVNMLSPGGIETGQDVEFRERFTRHVPMARMGGAHELRGALAFLSGSSSTYVTGNNLHVDGGVHVW